MPQSLPRVIDHLPHYDYRSDCEFLTTHSVLGEDDYLRLSLLVWFILATIWGTTWFFIKVGLNEELPPFTFGGVRFLLALFPLLVLIVLQKREFPKSRNVWIFMALTGILNFSINYGLVFWGAGHISSGLTAILATTIPLFGLVLAHLFIASEKIGIYKILSVILGIGGVTLIFIGQLEGSDLLAPLGSLAVILSAFGAALTNTLVKLHGGDIDPLILTSGQMLFGFMPLLAVGIIFEGNPLEHNWSSTSVLTLCYLAFIGSAVTFSLLYWLIKRVEVTKTQLIPFWSTLIAIFLGWIALGEQLRWNTLVGGAIILCGLGVALYRSKAPLIQPTLEPDSVD